MKQGCIFLVLAGLVLIGVAPAKGDSAASALMPAAQSCLAATSQALLPAAAVPSPQALALFCGSCSTPSCAGSQLRATCELGGFQGLGTCQVVTGCSGGGLMCACTSGPPP